MAVSKRAWLPLLFSVSTGAGICYAVYYVGQRITGGQSVSALAFASGVFLLWLVGFGRTWYFLSQYYKEENALSKTHNALVKLAQQINNVAETTSSPTLNGTQTPIVGDTRPFDSAQLLNAPDLPDTPLLHRRVVEALRAARRGAFPLASDMADSEERKLSAPERELRTYMDIALNFGIAGTFVSILVTFGQQQGLDANTLLAHIGPGMTSGLAAVVANIGLRLCHRALQDEQDVLAQRVDDTLADVLLANLNRGTVSPEDRLADAAMTTLKVQNAATQKTLSDQAEQFGTLLKEYARQIGTILTQQVQQPILQIAANTGTLATHTGALAQHSRTWADTVSNLGSVHAAFLNTQNEAQEQHEKRLAELFIQFRAALDNFLQTAQQFQNNRIQETQEFTQSLLATHTQALTGMTDHLRGQFITLQTEQEAAHLRMTEAALASLGNAVESRLTAIEDHVAALLIALESRLPSTLRDGVRDGLSEAVSLIDSVREQAGGLTHTISQISGNTDRQLQAYERWHERAMGVQGRLEQVVNDGQASQAMLLARWQAEATQTLDGVRAAFDVTAHEAKSGFTGLAAALDPLAEAVQHLQSTTHELQNVLTPLPPQVADMRAAVIEAAPPLRDLVVSCNNVHNILKKLSEYTAISLDRTKNVQEDAQRQSQETSYQLMTLTKAVGGAVTQMESAANTFAVVASRAPIFANGHTSDVHDAALQPETLMNNSVD